VPASANVFHQPAQPSGPQKLPSTGGVVPLIELLELLFSGGREMQSVNTKGILGVTPAVGVEDIAYFLLILGTIALLAAFAVGLWLIATGGLSLNSLLAAW
jgi:hypothetical protein